jgi:hypothetical protein
VFQAVLVAWRAPQPEEQLSAQQAQELISSARAILLTEGDEVRCCVDTRAAGRAITAVQNSLENQGQRALQAWKGAIQQLENLKSHSEIVNFVCCCESGVKFLSSQVLAPNYTHSLSISNDLHFRVPPHLQGLLGRTCSSCTICLTS